MLACVKANADADADADANDATNANASALCRLIPQSQWKGGERSPASLACSGGHQKIFDDGHHAKNTQNCAKIDQRKSTKTGKSLKLLAENSIGRFPAIVKPLFTWRQLAFAVLLRKRKPIENRKTPHAYCNISMSKCGPQNASYG